MTRPRLYKTAAERRVANCLKSRRSYHKHKNDISVRRRRNRAGPSESHASSRDASSCDIAPESTPPTTDTGRIPPDRGHTDELTQTDELEHRFRNIVGKSPSTFIEKLYRMYEMRLLEDGNDLSVLEDAISQLEGLSTSFTKCGDEMLQYEGCSTEYTRLDNIGREVQQVIRMLQEVLCEGLTEPLGLLIAHRNRSLSYQRA